jgi:hypothetical protein
VGSNRLCQLKDTTENNALKKTSEILRLYNTTAAELNAAATAIILSNLGPVGTVDTNFYMYPCNIQTKKCVLIVSSTLMGASAIGTDT